MRNLVVVLIGGLALGGMRSGAVAQPAGSPSQQPADQPENGLSGQAQDARAACQTEIDAKRKAIEDRLDSIVKEKEKDQSKLARIELDAFKQQGAFASLAGKECADYLQTQRTEKTKLKKALAEIRGKYIQRAQSSKAEELSTEIEALDKTLDELEWTPILHRFGSPDGEGQQWTRTARGLELPAGKADTRGFAKIDTTQPVALPVQVELKIARLEGAGPLQIATRSALIVLDDKNVSGVQMIDGKAYTENDSKHEGSVFSSTAPVALNLTLKDGSIQVTADGKEIVTWSGDQKKLKLPQEVASELKGAALGIYGVDAAFCLESIRFKALPAEKKTSPPPGNKQASKPKVPPTTDRAAGPFLPDKSDWTADVTVNGSPSPGAKLKVTSQSGDSRTLRVHLQNGAVFELNVKIDGDRVSLSSIPLHIRAANGGTRRTFTKLETSSGTVSEQRLDLSFDAKNNVPGGPQNQVFKMRLTATR